jgi:lipopolysaccharide export system protein LptA
MSTERWQRAKKNKGGPWLGAALLAGLLSLSAAAAAASAAEGASAGAGGAPPAGNPVRIQAENLVADMNANTAEFSDQVRVVNDAYTITADILTLHFKPQAEGQSRMQSSVSGKDISRMVARGRVIIRTGSLTASAELAEYEPDTGRVVLAAGGAAKTPADVSVGSGRPAAAAEAPPGRVRVTVRPSPDRR